MKLVLMSPDMNLGWVMMSLNTGMLWLTPGKRRREEGGGRRREVIAKEGGGVAIKVKCFVDASFTRLGAK